MIITGQVQKTVHNYAFHFGVESIPVFGSLAFYLVTGNVDFTEHRFCTGEIFVPLERENVRHLVQATVIAVHFTHEFIGTEDNIHIVFRSFFS